MKAILYKTTLTLLTLVTPLLLTANTGKLKGKYEREKTLKKEYTVNPTALLKVSNSYGDLNITSWDQNKVVIEVRITVSGNSEEKVEKKLHSIDVDFESSPSEVYAKTIFSKNKSWGWNWGRNNVSMRIDYNIKVPVKNSVSLSNDYGAIILDRIDGHARISCDYGRLDIGELRGRENQLNFDYTSKSKIGYMNSGKINADYSGFTIEKAGNLDINADYTNSKVIEMDDLEYHCDYGSIEIGKVNHIDGNGSYLSSRIGKVNGNLDIVSDYGSLKIEELTANAGDVSIRSDYTGVKIGYAPEYEFTFEIRTEYAGVKGKDDFEINISKERSSERYYKGYYGSSNSNNHMSINSEYGSVSFYQN
ncbi:hypothetical protein [Sediminicola luteus]|uniref:Adhesin domain-containing protein n=1 Tax=Sediminicola luteus TaxID=319238 RepID=A0A2A4GB91_9FLAO|nr:hypothetical protein [Sediminicola luteus]PCE65022.1 hypothetical protein B7P33_07665 [Sediminicola luteus]